MSLKSNQPLNLIEGVKESHPVTPRFDPELAHEVFTTDETQDQLWDKNDASYASVARELVAYADRLTLSGVDPREAVLKAGARLLELVRRQDDIDSQSDGLQLAEVA